MLDVFNKSDRAEGRAEALAHRHEGVAVSALTGDGLPALVERILQTLVENGKLARA